MTRQKLIPILAAICAMLTMQCRKNDEAASQGKGQGPSGGAGGQRGPAVISVRTQALKRQDLPRVIELVSVLSGRKQAEVYSRAAGRVSYLGKPEGSKVKQGELLFRVDRSDPGEAFLATPIVSPIEGWIGRWLVTSLGTQVNPDQAVVTIVDDERLKATVYLASADWLLVGADTKAEVWIAGQAQKDAIREGRVTGVTRAADSASSRGVVTVEIDNADHAWKAGMVGQVRFSLDFRPRLIVPASALAITDQGAFIFTAENGKAKRQPVTFQVVNNDEVEITSNIAEGGELIVEGVNQVSDGLAISVVEPKQGS